MEKEKNNAVRIGKHSFVTCLVLMNLVSACSKGEGPTAAPPEIFNQTIDDKTNASNQDGESQDEMNLVGGVAAKIMAGPVVNGVVRSVTGDIIATGVIGGGAVGVNGAMGGVDAAKNTAIGIITDYHNIPILGDAVSICEFAYHGVGLAIDGTKAIQCNEAYLRSVNKYNQVNNAMPQDEKEQRRKDNCTGLIDNMTLAIKGMLDNEGDDRMLEACPLWSKTLSDQRCTAADASAGTSPPALADASAEDREKFMRLKEGLTRNSPGKVTCLNLPESPTPTPNIMSPTNNRFSN